MVCRYLDLHLLQQVMGHIPGNQLVNPVAWVEVELDLCGPWRCQSEVNKRSGMKVWGSVMQYKNSRAIHCDIVMDYSMKEVIKMLRRFGALRGWPERISSDLA